MSFAHVISAQPQLLGASLIRVETDISNGLHNFSIVGLPDKAVEEARDRVGAAIKNSGFKSPKNQNKKIVISLAPANLKKEGVYFDVAIALGYLKSIEDIKGDLEGKVFIGELSLDGHIQKVHGVLPIVQKAKEEGYAEIYVPYENKEEASYINGITVYAPKTLKELIDHIEGLSPLVVVPHAQPGDMSVAQEGFSYIKDQEVAKRALTIAAAGKHNIALYGPPGTGKTMLARGLAGIMPQLTFDEALEVTSIYSVAGLLEEPIKTAPPFRSPHHSASHVSLTGGGRKIRPGEITLAHRGVLFLDEFPEFDRRVIESLRQPLEDRYISVTRAEGSAQFPANIILVAAMNPCPCGFYGFKGKPCICSASAIEKYKKKISGPIVDRIDLWVEVNPIDHEKLLEKENTNREADEEVRVSVREARERQKSARGKLNGELDAKDIISKINLGEKEKEVLNEAARTLGLSPRSYHRVIKVAQTIANLEGSEEIEEKHLFEALQYRPKLEN